MNCLGTDFCKQNFFMYKNQTFNTYAFANPAADFIFPVDVAVDLANPFPFVLTHPVCLLEQGDSNATLQSLRETPCRTPSLHHGLPHTVSRGQRTRPPGIPPRHVK